ncbi:peptidoglycan-binding protein [Paractinoplanes hotanensis]|uniref:Peptidoglycan-binding protein n=1 Tax=Paractinoplanes hotanensis TaxID=2906497 RepID=A0ABT0YEM3_9ACTN|nr:peptidoglycan-binding protein [Actinoplanes hotanensis]MCM4084255.1 peptidoglycan-binding protein [Actinoplanes hotanensis]
MTRRWRTALAIGAGAVVIAAAATASVGVVAQRDDAPPPEKPHVGTAQVVRTTLQTVTTAQGQIGYGRGEPITSRAAGTLTWLPAAGAKIRRGKPVLRADNKPVVLLYGDLPMYRPLAEDTEGPDVRQLEANLRSLGYLGFTVDDRYTGATAAAVKRWQKSLEREQTGQVAPADVIVASGALHVVSRTARPGAPATGDLLTASSTALRVTAEVPQSRPELTVAGTRASLQIPGGDAVAAKVTGLTAAAPPPADPAAGEADPAVAEGAQPSARTVTVRLAPDSSAGLRPGPLTVRFVTDRRADVLAVPVQALLALGEGGFGVEIRAAGVPGRVVAVKTGLFSGGLVEISGPDIDEGLTVGVAE